MDHRYVQLEEDNAKLQREIKQLTDDNKLMWDLWKQVQTSKPDITKIIATTAERETKKFTVKEKQMWDLIADKDSIIQRLEDQLAAKDQDKNAVEAQISNMKANESQLRLRLKETTAIEDGLKDEIERLSQQLIDSDDVNNRLLISMEKENTSLKKDAERLQSELSEIEAKFSRLKADYDSVSQSGNTLWTDLTQCRQVVAIMEKELEGYKETCSELRRTLDDERAQLECVVASKDRILSEMDNQSRLIGDLECKLEKVSQRNCELEKEVFDLRQTAERSRLGLEKVAAAATEFSDNATQHSSPLGRPITPPTPALLMDEIRELKDQLARMTNAYELKTAEIEMLRNAGDKPLKAVERLHSEQRAIYDELDGLNRRLQQKDLNSDKIQHLESSLETERLIAVLKQHCRELGNDRDVFAGRLEKALLQLANRESCVADLKVRLANSRRDREAEIRKINAENDRRIADVEKQHANKISCEVSRQRNQVACLEKKLELQLSEKRRIRAQLTTCQARLTRETTLASRQHERIRELEQSVALNDVKESKRLAAEQDIWSRRRRTRSASLCAQRQMQQMSSPGSPPRKKALTFDMAIQTEETAANFQQQQQQQSLQQTRVSPSVSMSSGFASRGHRRAVNCQLKQQLNLERSRVARLLRVAADLKSDRVKLRQVFEEERGKRTRLESRFSAIEDQLSSTTSDCKQLEIKLQSSEADCARLRKAVLDFEQKAAEMEISPRVDKSVITDQFNDSPYPPTHFHVSLEAFEDVKQRLAVALATEREQLARLSHFQLETDRLSADLALAKERLNDARREQAKERRLSEEQREKIRELDQKVVTDEVRLKDLVDRLAQAERSDKGTSSRIAGLRRRIDDSEREKARLAKKLDEKQCDCDRLAGNEKKLRTRCHYLEVMLTAQKTNYAKLEASSKEDYKAVNSQIALRSAQLSEFRRFVEMFTRMLVDRIRSDQRVVSTCEFSADHANDQRPRRSPGKRAFSRASGTSVMSRAASIAQAHLKLTAAEAAELLMVGSVDASPAPSSLGLDSPDAVFRKISNIIREIFDGGVDHEDAAQFANRLCSAIFNGVIDHIRYLLSRPPCCIKAVVANSDRDDNKSAAVPAASYDGEFKLSHQHLATTTTCSSAVGFGDSIYSESSY